MFFLQSLNSPCVLDRGIDLQTVTDDPRILKQAGPVLFGELRYLRNVKTTIGLAEVLRFFSGW